MDKTRVFKGIGVSNGVAIGPVVVREDASVIVSRCLLGEDIVKQEIDRLNHAVEVTREQLEKLKSKIAKEINVDYAVIFDAQQLMLEDDSFYGLIIETIKNEKINAEWAVDKITRKYLKAFQDIEVEYLRERSYDIKDLSKRVIKNMGSQDDHTIQKLTEPSIIITHDLPLSELSALEQDKLLGFATEVGGRTSHLGLFARSLEMPAVVGLGKIVDYVETGDVAIIDGEESILIINPSDNQLNEYRNKLRLMMQVEKRLIKNKDLPAVTTDGFEVNLQANIDLPSEVKSALEHGAHGIGLFRSEFLFIQKPHLINDEEAHFNLYRKLVKEIAPYPATVRILDIGSDKYIQGNEPTELNPALGLRAIRYFLRDRETITAQLRGMLRASTFGKLQILVPFVSGITEVYQILEIIKEIKDDLRRKAIDFDRDIRIGLMIEIPSAALISDLLADYVDFFSVGTNDLIQYTLAIDRSNEKVSYLYRPLHPAIITLLQKVIEAGRNAGIPVTVCGETAADPMSMVVLLGMKYPNLSMNAVSIPLIKNIIRAFSLKEAESIVNEIKRKKTSRESEEFILETLTAKFPSGYPTS